MYDILVVGAGAMGIASALQAARRGLRVAVLEQFELLHKLGSSHGESRIIRKTYEQDYFTILMEAAYDAWSDWDQLLKMQTIEKTGGLIFGDPTNEFYQRTLQACQSTNLDYEILAADQIRRRFPQLKIPDHIEGIYQADAGILNPDRILAKAIEEAKALGVEFFPYHEVLNIKHSKTDVLIECSTQDDMITFNGLKAIITVGPWIRDILAKLGLKLSNDIIVQHLTFGYFKVEQETWYTKDNFPIFINLESNQLKYGFPVMEKPGYIKIAPHYSYHHILSASQRDNVPDHHVLEDLQQFIGSRFNGVISDAEHIETCLYTMDPEENFILDFHPNTQNIVFGGCFSGHGFKFTPLIGNILVDLIVQGKTHHNISHFSLENRLTS